MSRSELQRKYQRGFYGIIQPELHKIYHSSAGDTILMYMIHAADHLFSAELFPYYQGLGKGFNQMATRSKSKCKLKISFTTSHRAQISLAKLASLGKRTLDTKTQSQLARFMEGMKNNLEADNPIFIMAGTSGALALSEMIMCPEHRGEFVSTYYEIRPRLVRGGILTTEVDGNSPLSRYRIFRG